MKTSRLVSCLLAVALIPSLCYADSFCAKNSPACQQALAQLQANSAENEDNQSLSYQQANVPQNARCDKDFRTRMHTLAVGWSARVKQLEAKHDPNPQMDAMTKQLMTQIKNLGTQYQKCMSEPQPILKGPGAGASTD